jgi:hypothetical protein
MRLNENEVGHNCAEAAEGGDESELAQSFAQAEIKLESRESELPLKRIHLMLEWEFHRAAPQQQCNREQKSLHNSFPENTTVARAV